MVGAAPGSAHPHSGGTRPAARTRWAWAPWAALCWALGYGALRIRWAVLGPPGFGVIGTDLIGFTGWGGVALCGAAAAVALAQAAGRWHRAVEVAGWLVAALLVMACPLLLIDVVGLLLPGLGLPLDPGAFASRGACLAGAVAVAAGTRGYRSRRPGGCARCGRTGAAVRGERLPAWAWWAAYAAVAGCAARVAVQWAVGFADAPLRAGAALAVFDAGFALAGSVLPLAVVHSWGWALPSWLPLLAGRRVPHRLVLVPAFAVAGALTAYFGAGTVQLAVETATGTWTESEGLPLAFYWITMPAYLVWGLGLGAAALARHRLSRPPCPACGR
ncbi:hypothetical protein [Marinitenerispora sediminis]|uniref:Uncharacterized protein n=1 Tax=Marinitenerispora sediminis TaxID=1931232 RepID=A0A368TAS8_9ACTN|nr:hypothetical protein [Marinitenerispora sediminis]RCV56984.1 hypothetical protein DEF28_02605 [Marinitenerispora sediminis]RCV60189.1 hypothetical protein DEF23_05340 [Marinitenerispora sediminis]RCV62105.1 hypothetical protein DEF24_02345 [Marinitenerispora sediminis]